jgi:translation initiation factor 2B subunit (eIF-2B alpha/beta/delta family)
MSNETRPEQQSNPHEQSIPLEVLNMELSARLRFAEDRLLATATAAFSLQVKCNELAAALAERTEEISALQMAVTAAEAKAAEAQAQAEQRIDEAGADQIQKSPRKR